MYPQLILCDTSVILLPGWETRQQFFNTRIKPHDTIYGMYNWEPSRHMIKTIYMQQTSSVFINFLLQIHAQCNFFKISLQNMFPRLDRSITEESQWIFLQLFQCFTFHLSITFYYTNVHINLQCLWLQNMNTTVKSLTIFI